MAVTRDKLPAPPAQQARDIVRRTVLPAPALEQPRLMARRWQARASRPLGNGLVVRRTIAQPADGSDFFVNLPYPLSGDYSVSGVSVLGASIPVISCVNEGVGDRTGSRFRVVTSFALSTSDVLEFVVFPF